MAEATGYFVRRATGLMRSWSAFDAFIYAFFSVNFVTLGMYIMSFGPFVPQGHLLPAAIITGVFVTFLVVVYAGLIATMPRAGGDYVWQSRILGGGIAFVLAVTGWWFILWHWVPIYGNILSVQVFGPILATVGRVDLATWFGTPNGIFASSLIVVAFVAYYIAIGMERYARIQKLCFWGGIVALAVVFLLLLIGSQGQFQQAFNREAARLFGASGDAYTQTIEASRQYGFTPPPFGAMSLGPSILLIPMLVFYLLWPNWGATLSGEVRGASDYRRSFNGMFWGLWITVALSVVFFLLVAKTMGWEFYQAANSNYWATIYTPDKAPKIAVPLWPYPAMLAGWLIDSRILQVILLALMSLWFWGWSGTVFLSSTRVIFAAAFDRVLPEWAARVSPRSHVPTGALLLMVVPSIVVSYLYAYRAGFAAYTLDATLVIAVTYLGSVVAATILPWRRPRLYEGSPAARYKVAGVPLVTVAGVVTIFFLAFNLWKWITDATYGVNNRDSAIYMLILYALALAIYVIARVVRARQGIDLARTHAEIPVE
jgi:amino acid transporter